MIAFLNALLVVLYATLIIAVLAILVIGADLAYYTFDGWNREDRRIKNRANAQRRMAEMKKRAQDELRVRKEAEAAAGFFETKYFRGFDSNGSMYYRGHKVPTMAALEYYRKMDELADTQLFNVIFEED